MTDRESARIGATVGDPPPTGGGALLITDRPRPSPAPAADALRHIPQWFIAVAALTYSTGFLIVFTFLERFGIRDTGADFLKVRYLHVGILYLIFPAALILPLAAFAYVRLTTSIRRPSGPGMLLGMNVLVVFYILATFLRPGHFVARLAPLILLFVTTIGGSVILWVVSTKTDQRLQEVDERMRLARRAATADDEITERRLRRRLKRAAASRYLLLIPTLALDVWALHGSGLARLFWSERLWLGAVFFLLFVAGAACIIGVAHWRLQLVDGHSAKIGLWVITACFAFALYYLSVLSFAHGVYRFIPVSRGGGDYVGTASVTLRFRRAPGAESPTEGIPQEIVEWAEIEVNRSKLLKLIEVTPTAIFVALPRQGGGPACWRRPGGSIPRVFELRRDAVASMTYEDPDPDEDTTRDCSLTSIDATAGP